MALVPSNRSEYRARPKRLRQNNTRPSAPLAIGPLAGRHDKLPFRAGGKRVDTDYLQTVTSTDVPDGRTSSRALGSASDLLREPPSFSLTLGGPLFQLLRRAHLCDDALELVKRRVVVISLFAWFPLLLLSALDGHLLGNGVRVPFLPDLETHIRFLVIVPMLLVAELVVHQRLLPVGRSFLDRKLIPDGAMPRFEDALRSALRLRNSVFAEVLLLAFVYAVGVLIVWRRFTILPASTWYATSHAPVVVLSSAGIWYRYVSLPIFQFLLIRWYFRLFIWTRFLWQVSRIELNLVPTHPDLLGGLGFLAETVYAFTLLLVAHGTLISAQVADRIFFVGSPLGEFKTEVAVVVVFLLSVIFGPLFFFAPQLAWTKRNGLREYGTFAEGYVRDFDDKWLRRADRGNEPLLGSSDIQSLADLANSFDVIRHMRLIPITRDALVRLTLAILVPVLPLLLTVMPLEALLQKLLGLVF